MVKRETTIPKLLDIIIENLNEAEEFIDSLTFAEFLKDKKTIRACERNIEIIGDSCKEILNRAEREGFNLDSETIQLFKTVYGARNFLSHGYDFPDEKILYNILIDELPVFKNIIEKLICRY